MASKIQSDKLQWELSIKDSEAQRNIANLTKANKDYEKSNKEIRLEMARLEAQGKKNSSEYKGLQTVLKQNNNQISNNSKLIKENESALGTQNMTMNQLKKRYKELLKEMNNTSKAADPKTWNSLKTKLEETKGAMGDLAGGTKKAEGVMVSWGSAMKVGVMNVLASLGQKVLSAAADLFSFEKIINSNQATGDLYAATVSGLKNAFGEFRRSLATMDFSNFTENLQSAYKVAYEVAIIMDELFERQNSFKIQDIQVKAEIENLYEKMNNVNLSYSERKDAGDKITALTKQQAEIQKEIYKDEADANRSLISGRTKLNDKQLEFYIDQYNANRDIITQAREYLKLQDQIADIAARPDSRVTIKGTVIDNRLENQENIKKAKEELNQFEKLNAKNIESIKQAADIAKGYDKANDEFVTKYVESRVKMLNVDVESAKSLRRVNNQVNSMIKGIATQNAQRQKEIAKQAKVAQEKDYQAEIALAENAYKDKLTSLKEMYAAGLTSQQEYNLQTEQLEQEVIEKKIEINLLYSRSVDELQTNLLDKQIAKINKFKAVLENLKKEADGIANKSAKEVEKKDSDSITADIEEGLAFMDEAAAKSSQFLESQKTELDEFQDLYDAELLQLQDSLDLKLLSEEQYQEAVSKLNEESWIKRFNINSAGAKKTLGIVNEALAVASQVITQLQEVETSKLEAQKQRELSIYGDTYEKRAEIEEKYEEKKLEVQKKYADIDMAVKISQALAAGALGIMTAIAQLGPLSGPAIALISATTAAQVAMIVAQRNAIANTSASSGSVSSGGTLNVIRDTSASTSSSSVEMPTAQQPVTSSQIGVVNEMKKGESASKQASVTTGQTAVMKEVSTLLKDLRDKPIAAYTVLSQQQAQKEQFERIKKEGSL